MAYEDKKIKVPQFNEDSGFYTTKKRSRMMSKIRGKDSKPEVKFRKALWHLGYRYRKNYKHIIGKPDIVLIKYETIIFIDGEFWHGYKWSEKKEKIKSNRGFWIPKIERNMQRDQEVNEALKEKGYKVFRFWQKDIKQNLNSCIEEIIKHIENIDEESIFQTP